MTSSYSPAVRSLDRSTDCLSPQGKAVTDEHGSWRVHESRKGGEKVTSFFTNLIELRKREEGQTMAEYGVVLAVITLGVVLALGILSGAISDCDRAGQPASSRSRCVGTWPGRALLRESPSHRNTPNPNIFKKATQTMINGHAIRNQRGQTMTEFALILPVFALLLLGIIQFGVAFNHYLTVTDAARAGSPQGGCQSYGDEPERRDDQRGSQLGDQSRPVQARRHGLDDVDAGHGRDRQRLVSLRDQPPGHGHEVGVPDELHDGAPGMRLGGSAGRRGRAGRFNSATRKRVR